MRKITSSLEQALSRLGKEDKVRVGIVTSGIKEARSLAEYLAARGITGADCKSNIGITLVRLTQEQAYEAAREKYVRKIMYAPENVTAYKCS